MRVHLVDGTYELFRYHFALPPHQNNSGQHTGAVRGVVSSMLSLLEDGATHVGIATDHVIESFRNDLYSGYKDGSGTEPEILSQFGLLEDVLEAAGFCVFAMVEYEADDALGACAHLVARDESVDQVMICTPDKDLGQCVTADNRVVQYDRRKQLVIDTQGVVDKFGVLPESIPDYLGLVGDSADGFPGLPGWGAKSASAVLAQYLHIEDIPAEPGKWDVQVRGAAKLAKTLREQYEDALLFRRIATIDYDAPTVGSVSELEWSGPGADFPAIAAEIDASGLVDRANQIAEQRTAK
ncbi:MAG: 5'-3' exonuclease [Acidimicrobiales bacterium]